MPKGHQGSCKDCPDYDMCQLCWDCKHLDLENDDPICDTCCAETCQHEPYGADDES